MVWDLREAGVRVPEDVAFITLWNQTAVPDVAGMLLCPDEIGRRAVDWLDSLMRAGERGLPAHPATMHVDLTWQDGRTRPA